MVAFNVYEWWVELLKCDVIAGKVAMKITECASGAMHW